MGVYGFIKLQKQKQTVTLATKLDNDTQSMSVIFS